MIGRRAQAAVLAVGMVAAAEGSGRAATNVLPLTAVTQEHSQWCWAAVTQGMLRFEALDSAQCWIAEYARTAEIFSDVSLGAVDCCVDWTQGCDTWNYFWGGPGSLQDLLAHFGGITADPIGSPLQLAQVIAQIDAGHPFVFRWQWDTGGGHFLIGHGYSDNLVYYSDSLPGGGLNVGDYDWLVSSASHTWINTLTTNAVAVQPDAAPASDAQLADALVEVVDASPQLADAPSPDVAPPADAPWPDVAPPADAPSPDAAPPPADGPPPPLDAASSDSSVDARPSPDASGDAALAVDASSTPDFLTGGCGCAAGGQRTASCAALLLLPLAFVRRRWPRRPRKSTHGEAPAQ